MSLALEKDKFLRFGMYAPGTVLGSGMADREHNGPIIWKLVKSLLE